MSEPSQTTPPGNLYHFAAGTLLIEEDKISRKLFILRSGKARVFRMHMGTKVTLAILGEGEIIGEMGFFGANTRSASVEAMTDLSSIVIDDEQAKKQMENLPSWVTPLLRTTFNRFRLMDLKLAQLQNLYEFQKKNFKSDRMASAVYHEGLRILDILHLVYNESVKQGEPEAELLYKKVDQLFGERTIGVQTFLTRLEEFALIVTQSISTSADIATVSPPGMKKVIKSLEPLNRFQNYLKNESDSKRFLLLSGTAMNIFERIVFTLDSDPNTPGIQLKPSNTQESSHPQTTYDEIRVGAVAFYEKGISDLENAGLIETQNRTIFIKCELDELYDHYVFQKILSGFNLTDI